MILNRRFPLPALLVFGLLAGGCQSLDVENNQFAIINVPTTAVEGGFTTTPSAFFFEGVGIRLSTTDVGSEGCVVRVLETSNPGSFNYIDAGAAVDVTLAGSDATLTPSTVGARTIYQLPAGTSLSFTPGDQITFSIPGAVGGFPSRIVRAQTAEAFTPGAVTIPTSTTENLELTWSPTPSAPGTAMFYSFKYATADAALFNREIACVFNDDGTGLVPAAALEGFRTSQIHSIIAQRARITVERIGTAVSHVTSTLSVPVELLDNS